MFQAVRYEMPDIDRYIAERAESLQQVHTAEEMIRRLRLKGFSPVTIYAAARAVVEVLRIEEYEEILASYPLHVTGKDGVVKIMRFTRRDTKEWERTLRSALGDISKPQSDVRLTLAQLFFIDSFSDSRIRLWEEPDSGGGVAIRTNKLTVVAPYWSRVRQVEPDNPHLLYHDFITNATRKQDALRQLTPQLDRLPIFDKRFVLAALSRRGDPDAKRRLKALLVKNPTHPVNLHIVLSVVPEYRAWFEKETGLTLSSPRMRL